MGFLDDLAKNAALWAAVEASKDENGKPDPYKAAGMAAGTGNFSFGDRMRLGAMLGSQGAFDADDDYDSLDCGYEDDSWKLYCEDGSEFNVDPDDFHSKEEYEEALEEAKYAWRDTCEEGLEYGVDASNYETEKEYEEALEEAKYAWRDICEDGLEYGIFVEDYETEEAYEEALNEAKYGWRDYCKIDIKSAIKAEDYETEEEYEKALTKAKYAWRDTCEDGSEYGIDVEDYETEEEYEEALEEVQTVDFVSVPITLQVSIPKREISDAHSRECVNRREPYMWRKKYLKQETYGISIYKYKTEESFLKALNVAKKKFIKMAKNDKTIYYYCAVVYDNGSNYYHYRTEDTSLKIGDKVVVPVGNNGEECIAQVVSIEQHSRLTVPYPVEKTKYIIRKYEE